MLSTTLQRKGLRSGVVSSINCLRSETASLVHSAPGGKS